MKAPEFEKIVPTWTEERIKKLVAERRYKAVPVDPYVFGDLVQKGITKEMEVKASGVPEMAICVNWTFVPISNTMLYYFVDETFEKIPPGVEVPLIEPAFTKIEHHKKKK